MILLLIVYAHLLFVCVRLRACVISLHFTHSHCSFVLPSLPHPITPSNHLHLFIRYPFVCFLCLPHLPSDDSLWLPVILSLPLSLSRTLAHLIKSSNLWFWFTVPSTVEPIPIETDTICLLWRTPKLKSPKCL